MLFTRLLQDLPLPSQCAVCRGWGVQRLCADCLTRFAAERHRCHRCALETSNGTVECGACLRDPPPYAATFAAVDYSHPWDGLITHFKFHAALDLAPAMATRLVAAVRRGGAQLPELLLPVPLSTARLRERGFNQAWELARRVGRALARRAEARLLLRIRNHPHQLALPLERRAANVRGAFAVEPLRAAELRDRNIALIDDVMTSGATAAEATRVLLQAGARTVQVWVVARTPRPEDR